MGDLGGNKLSGVECAKSSSKPNGVSQPLSLALANLLNKEVGLLEYAASAVAADKIVIKNYGIGLYSHEFRLIFHVLANGGMAIKDAALFSMLSHRAFYELLKRMENDGIIYLAKSNTDRRVKTICLVKNHETEFLAAIRRARDCK